jgi:tyrosine-protein kinase Etk/Wzc
MEKLNGKTNMHSQNSASGGSKEVSFHDYLAILYRSRWVILTVFLTVMAAVSYYTFTTSPTYEASATIMVDEKQGIGQSLFDVTGFSQQRTLINNQVEILKSRALHFAALQRLLDSSVRDSLQLFSGLDTEKTMADVYELLLESINIAPIRDTDLIKINVQAETPFESAYLANTVAESYRDMDQNLSRGEISQVVQFLEEQLEGKEQDLKASEEKLKDYLEDEKIGSLSDEATQLVEKSAEFESFYKEALIDLQAANKRLDHIKGMLGKSQESLESELASVSNPLVLQLRKEMAEIERTIALYLSQGVTDRDPQVYQERDKLDAIKDRLTEETRKIIMQGLPSNDPLAHAQGLVRQILKLETEVTSLQARAEGLGRVVDTYTSRLEALPDKNIHLARLERNRQVDEKLYVMMREKFEESRITKAGQIGKVRILDHAVAPIDPVFPKKKMNLLIGLMLGLGLGGGIFQGTARYIGTASGRYRKSRIDFAGRHPTHRSE